MMMRPAVRKVFDEALRHHQAGRIDEAASRYRQTLCLKPDCAEAHNNLGMVCLAQGRADEAIAHWRRALAFSPGLAEAHNNLGTILKEQGQFDDALTHYTQAITARPDYPEAHYNRAEIRTFRIGDADLAALEALAGRSDLPADKALYVHFALAKAFEDIGDYARAFEHLCKGNVLNRRSIDYDEARELKFFQRISSVFDGALFERFQGEGNPSTVPVFVLGMPRSGTSLIEQILASHPQIHGAGELTDLEAAARSVLSASGQRADYPECIPALDAVTLERMGQAYLSRLPATANGKVRIVNKLPGNFLHIGLIRLILPNARIIHTARHPADTCVSCYSKLFTSSVNYSYDLAELGRYYRGYSELMTHWRTVLPPSAILHVSYEEVVDDLEGQARRLIDYCGLPWDDRCVAFHRTDRRVATASAVQVRQSVFRTSLQRWRRYEAGIGPLLHELGDLIPGQTIVPDSTPNRPLTTAPVFKKVAGA